MSWHLADIYASGCRVIPPRVTFARKAPHGRLHHQNMSHSTWQRTLDTCRGVHTVVLFRSLRSHRSADYKTWLPARTLRRNGPRAITDSAGHHRFGNEQTNKSTAVHRAIDADDNEKFFLHPDAEPTQGIEKCNRHKCQQQVAKRGSRPSHDDDESVAPATPAPTRKGGPKEAGRP